MNISTKKSIAIIGLGTVGSSIAYTLVVRRLASSLLLVDIDEQRCRGERLDLQGAISFDDDVVIKKSTLQEASQADIVIIAVGKPQKKGESRRELFAYNRSVVASIIQDMKSFRPDIIIIVVTNPVDNLAQVVQHITQLPHHQIIGSGTILDTQRLRSYLAQQSNCSRSTVKAYVLGEHGDSQFISWSSARIEGILIDKYPFFSEAFKQECEQATKNAAYEIIACKGSTAWGVACCVGIYCDYIMNARSDLIPVSCYQKEFDVYLSMPVEFCNAGIQKIVTPSFNDREHKQLYQSVQAIKSVF